MEVPTAVPRSEGTPLVLNVWLACPGPAVLMALAVPPVLTAEATEEELPGGAGAVFVWVCCWGWAGGGGVAAAPAVPGAGVGAGGVPGAPPPPPRDWLVGGAPPTDCWREPKGAKPAQSMRKACTSGG